MFTNGTRKGNFFKQSTLSFHQRSQTLQDGCAIRIPQISTRCALRMWHHAENVHGFVCHTSDIRHSSIRVGPVVDIPRLVAVFEEDLVVIF